MAILNEKKVAANGLLSKIEIGGKVYDIKDVIAREAIDALSYISYTNIFANDAAIKEYVDSQVGSINKFDVVIGTADAEGKPNVAASAETMYKIYLIPGNPEAGSYIEWITIREGENYKWEAIGSTAVSLDGYVTGEALNNVLKDYAKTADLGALAFADSATGTVAGQTIQNVKATGKTEGSINVALTKGSEPITLNGNYTPAGTVTGGKVTAAGTVSVSIDDASGTADLTRSDYTPEGQVSVTPASAEVQVIKTAGTAASFVEGKFNEATCNRTEVSATYATNGITGTVNDDECLVFGLADTATIEATKINSFFGGSKDADTWTANIPATVETKTVVTGIAETAFTGTKAEKLKVDTVTYVKHGTITTNFEGKEVDVTGAGFSGEAATISTSGNMNTYAVDTENTKFAGADITLAVDNITIESKEVTVTPTNNG